MSGLNLRTFLVTWFLLFAFLLAFQGCTFSPKFAPVQFSPLLDINIKDSANGNTVPVSAAP